MIQENEISLCSFSFYKKLAFYVFPKLVFLLVLVAMFFVGIEKIKVYYVMVLSVFIAYLVKKDDKVKHDKLTVYLIFLSAAQIFL